MSFTNLFIAGLLLAAALLPGVTAAAPEPSRESQPPGAPVLRVMVDPRVELLSLIFQLAGNREYSQPKVDSYAKDVAAQFDAAHDHPVVRLAAELRHTRGVSYDAVMGMAVHLTDTEQPQLRTALTPWPESLDQRWPAPSASNFVHLAGQFVRDARFPEFLQSHRELYATTTSRLQSLLDQHAHLEWFPAYFGERSQAAFTVIPALLNGGNCYGAHFKDSAGHEELFCLLGVWQTDAAGLPEFTESMLPTVVHEFCHSYANPIIDRHESELQAAGQKLFRSVAAQMRSQAYGNAATMLRESLVRACTVRYVRQFSGAEAASRAIDREQKRGFLWMRELSDLLGDYETHRETCRTLDDFAPRLVAFFSEYAEGFAERSQALAAKQPKVSSMSPANGATAVDPGQKEIKVVFDRPMRDASWSMCGSGPHCPNSTGQAHYDAQRTTWTVPVALKPGWDYEFSLNCESYKGFQSEDGVPLESVPVTFHTADLPKAAETR